MKMHKSMTQRIEQDKAMTTPAQQAAEALSEAGKLHLWPESRQGREEATTIISAAYVERDKEIKRVIEDAVTWLDGDRKSCQAETLNELVTQLREAIGKL